MRQLNVLVCKCMDFTYLADSCKCGSALDCLECGAAKDCFECGTAEDGLDSAVDCHRFALII